MTKAKANYKNMHFTQLSRGLNLEDETQQHILEECVNIHTDEETTIPLHDIFETFDKHRIV